ncbi:phosphatase PAP2 family protein [Paenibacillus sp. Dod16]|uniref:phosphatase PAP2 family protein n=1 Tax=Paenibacillus sp. Dod16 TaxID=3416392 RepID=UPI003CE7790F
MIKRLRRFDHRVFVWCNQTISNRAFDRLFGGITHLGGATFTILSALLIAWAAFEAWDITAYQSAIALTVSHLIVVLIKKIVRRDRPFRVLEQVKIGNFPLKDYSFPSGHTTAIFAVITPLLFLVSPLPTILLLILAVLVGLSRIYWGYHYPTDCLAGSLIGFGSGWLVVYLMHVIGIT